MTKTLVKLALLAALAPSVYGASCGALAFNSFTNNLDCVGSSTATGTVTSVSFTGGIISVANPTTTPAFTVAGTSGGIPYFSSASTWASSGVLGANLPLFGGGAGASPIAGTRSGNTTVVVTTTGTQTSGDCVKIDASGNHIANGAACASFASLIPTSPNSSITIGNTGTAAPTLDINTTYANALWCQLIGCTYTGKVIVTPTATTAGFNVVSGSLPSSQSAGDIFCNAATICGNSDGTNANVWVLFAGNGTAYTTAPTSGHHILWGSNYRVTTTGSAVWSVANGGTGLATLTAHAVYVGNGTSAPAALSVGATNTVLRGSTGADPAFGSLVTADLPVALANQTSLRGNAMAAAAGDATIGQVIAHGAKALDFASTATGACATVITDTATGTASTDTIIFNANASIKAVTGFVPAATGGFSIAAYPTTDTVNFEACNWTSGTVDPGSITVNWKVVR